MRANNICFRAQIRKISPWYPYLSRAMNSSVMFSQEHLCHTNKHSSWYDEVSTLFLFLHEDICCGYTLEVPR